MSPNQNCFFIVEFVPDGKGVPHFFDKDWIPDLPDYSFYDFPPCGDKFSSHYSLKAKTSNLSGDYFIEDDLASMDMCVLCDKLNVKFIRIPVEVELYRGRTPNKKYFLFFLKSYLSILDEERSIYSKSTDLKNENFNVSGEDERFFYDSIELFKVKDSVSENLFFCNELMLPVCSAVFKEECERLGLEGVGFKPLDDNYKYSAWDDLDLS
ncbi:MULTISPECIES: hypothetical protein [Pectobacterium]|uniref:hypothetical protein n=1 Tax=Pectobacterium TaxID=122277 RepID=UPI001B38FE01|nr:MULTISPECIES: hypothetical protein [Pectobacterium]MBQ4775585.1 hypothetical protein [Pectobacterium versatile]